jgi:hypothetical protein
MFDSLSDAQVALLANTLTKEAKRRRANLSPGEYTVAAGSIEVPGGTVTVGENEPTTPTVSVPLLPVLCIALHRAGFQRDGILALVVDAATEALDAGGKAGGELDATAAYVAQGIKELQATFAAKLPKMDRRGKVRVKVA